MAGKTGVAERRKRVPPKRKKKSRRTANQDAAEVEHLRPGMPAADNVQEVLDLVSPQGKKYEILRTSETDAYDPPLLQAKRSGAPGRPAPRDLIIPHPQKTLEKHTARSDPYRQPRFGSENLSLAELAVLEMTNPSVKRRNRRAYVLTTKNAYLWGVAISMLVERNPRLRPEVLAKECSRFMRRYERRVSKRGWKPGLVRPDEREGSSVLIAAVRRLDKGIDAKEVYGRSFEAVRSCVKKRLIDDPLHVAVEGAIIAVLGLVPVSFTRKTLRGKVVYRKISAAYWSYEKKRGKNGMDVKEVHFKLLTALKAFLKVLV